MMLVYVFESLISAYLMRGFIIQSTYHQAFELDVEYQSDFTAVDQG